VSDDQTPAPVMNTLSEVMDDLRDRLVARLERDGYEVPAEARIKVDRALAACLRVPHRSIPARPRAIHWSKELTARLPGMEAETRVGLDAVVGELRRGEDVNQRLTRRHYKAGFNDTLHNDLGVQHLHLGPRDQGLDKTHAHPMSGAADELLWVVAREDDVYLLEALGHAAFETFDFAKVIYDNWPHLLGPPVEGCSADEEDVISAEGRAKLRKIGIWTMVSFNGEVFIPGGFMNDGTSRDVVHVLCDTLNLTVDMYQWIEANTETVLAKIHECTGLKPTTLRVVVGDLDMFLRGAVSLVDLNAGMLFYVQDGVLRYRILKRTSG